MPDSSCRLAVLCCSLAALTLQVKAQLNPQYCSTSTQPGAWGGWTGWGACSAPGPGLQGLQSQKAQKCFKASKGQPSTKPMSKGECAPDNSKYALCSERQRLCKRPPSDRYSWIFEVDFGACASGNPCDVSGANVVGLCCKTVSIDGAFCAEPYSPPTACEGYKQTRNIKIPCLNTQKCPSAPEYGITFKGKCPGLVDNALMIGLLAVMLGFDGDQAVITQPPNCDQPAPANQLKFFFNGNGAQTASDVFEKELESIGSSVYTYMVDSGIKAVSTPQGTIDIVYCGAPVVASAKPHQSNRGDVYGAGSVVLFDCICRNCNEQRNAVCMEDGTWDVVGGPCPGDDGRQTAPGAVVCPPPPQITNGQYEGGNGGDSYQPGDKVTYSCVSGYKIDGRATVVCQDNGLWSDFPSCVVTPIWQTPTPDSGKPTPYLPPPGVLLPPEIAPPGHGGTPT